MVFLAMGESPSGEVWFYSDKEKPYGVFSNFYPVKITIPNSLGEMKEYPNSEAYYQAEKFISLDATKDQLEYAEIIRKQNTGNKAAVLARQKKPYHQAKWADDLWQIIQDYQSRGVKVRSDWDHVKNNVMRRAVYQKFSQSSALLKILLETDDQLIFEHTHRDHYWADGHPPKNSRIHGSGKNMLGIILEEVRFILGGKPSRRWNRSPFDDSNWVIPGMLLMSGCPDPRNYLGMKREGIRYFISLMESHEEQEINLAYRDQSFPEGESDFCCQSQGVTIARWSVKDRSVASDEKAALIAIRIIRAISRGTPVMVHCSGGKGRAGTITSLVVGFLYGVNGQTAIDITQRLFDDHRPNKGTKLPKIPQTKVQRSQITRILDLGILY